MVQWRQRKRRGGSGRGPTMTGKKYDRESCIRLLLAKRQELLAQGTDRLPQRSDFDNAQVVAIKAFLGAWPRALEQAGLKEPRPGDRHQRNVEKRRRARRRAREARRRENTPEVDEHDT